MSEQLHFDIWTIAGAHGALLDQRHVVLFVAEGTGSLSIDFQGYEINPGNVYFISPGQLCGWMCEGDFNGYVMAFAEGFLKWPGSPYESVFDLDFFHTVSRTPVIDVKAKAGAFVGQLEKIHAESQAGDNGDVIVLRSYFKVLMSHFKEMYAEALHVSSATKEPELLRRFKALVSNARGTGKDIQEYADRLGVKPARLKSAIKLSTGRSPEQIIEEEVVTASKRLLVVTNKELAEISRELGFDSPSVFEDRFIAEAGVSPAEFREKERDQYADLMR